MTTTRARLTLTAALMALALTLTLTAALMALALTLTLTPLQASHAVADTPPTPTPVTTPTPSYPLNQSPGVPAITPEPAMRAQALANTATYSTSATYTVADVRAFLAAHPLFTTTDGSPITITAILFIPAAQASARMGGSSADRPDSTVVCYVEVTGPLVVYQRGLPHDAWLHRGHHVAPPVYKPRVGRSHALTKLPVGQVVFDAQTGNLLSRGFYF